MLLTRIGIRLTLDVMCDFGFGQNVRLQKDQSLDYITKVIQNYSWRMGIYEQYPRLATLSVERFASMLRYGADLQKKFRSWSNSFASVIINRCNDKPKRRFDIVQDSRDPETGKGLSDLELWAEGSFMILAGFSSQRLSYSTSNYSSSRIRHYRHRLERHLFLPGASSRSPRQTRQRNHQQLFRAQ